ncbi:unnamed protein product [Schistosoma rodhaini]|nr:unnamed protein product [Schistosoma rodhaini]
MFVNCPINSSSVVTSHLSCSYNLPTEIAHNTIIITYDKNAEYKELIACKTHLHNFQCN